MAGTTRSWKRQRGILPWNLPRDHGPAHTLILDVWPPGLREDTFLLFEADQCVVLRHGRPGTRTQRVPVSLSHTLFN